MDEIVNNKRLTLSDEDYYYMQQDLDMDDDEACPVCGSYDG